MQEENQRIETYIGQGNNEKHIDNSQVTLQIRM